MSRIEMQFERRVRQILDRLIKRCNGLALGEVRSTDIRRAPYFVEVLAEFSLPRSNARLLFYSPEEDASILQFVKCEVRLQPTPTLEDTVVFSQCYESAKHLFGEERSRANQVLGVHQDGDFHEFTTHYSDFVSPFDADYASGDSVAFRRAA